MIKMYAIKNCNTVKKAISWLDDNAIEFEFIDYKKHGADRNLLQAWCDQFGWEKVMNRAGMTYRKLDADVKESLDEAKAIEIMLEKTSIIKRPILVAGDKVLLGFKPDEYEQLK